MACGWAPAVAAQPQPQSPKSPRPDVSDGWARVLTRRSTDGKCAAERSPQVATKSLVIVAVLMLCSLEAFANAAPSQQEGNKLVGTGAVGVANQAAAVALSGDGSTAIVGGARDNSDAGAAWVYTRSGGVSSQQGSKLVGTGARRSGKPRDLPLRCRRTGTPRSSVGSLTTLVRERRGCTRAAAACGASKAANWSAPAPWVTRAREPRSLCRRTGTPPIVGGSFDNFSKGAAWVYTRSGGVWSQQRPQAGRHGRRG